MGVNLWKRWACIDAVDGAELFHTQEVRRSSPCAPTIFLNQCIISTGSALLRFGQVVADTLRRLNFTTVPKVEARRRQADT